MFAGWPDRAVFKAKNRRGEEMNIVDESGKPRDTESILEAIEVMGKVLVQPLKHDPMIVVLAPTIRDGLKELLERRKV